MSPPDDLYPPITQSAGWTALAIGVLVLVAAWWVLVWWRTRRRRLVADGWRPLTGAALTARRAACLADVDSVALELEEGRCSTRDAFQRLSPIVRRFVYETSGLPAHTMTLAELRSAHPGPLVDTVAALYPSEFAAAVDGDARLGADRARRFVESWTPGAVATPEPVDAGVRR